MQYELFRSATGDYMDFIFAANMQFPIHLHRSFEFLAVEEGELNILIHGQNFTATAGNGLLILPNQPHAYATPQYSRIGLCIFSVDYLPEFSCVEHPQVHDPIFDRENGWKLLCALNQASANRYRMKSLFYEIAAQYQEGPVCEQMPFNVEPLSVRFAAYLENHFTEPISLNTAAQAMGYHPHYLSERIRQCFQASFSEVLNAYRIQYACALLHSSEKKTVTEIAQLAGYESLRSFDRNFQLRMGCTPRTYREKMEETLKRKECFQKQTG